MWHGLRTSGARVLLAGVACAMALLPAGRAGGQDSGRMERDLAVMEGILSSLCAQARPDGGDGMGSRPFWRGEPAVTAVRVDGYGPVFVLEDCLAAERARAVVGVWADVHPPARVRR